MALTSRLCSKITAPVTLPPTLHSSSAKFGLNLVSNEAVLVAAAAEALALMAAEAARDPASVSEAWAARRASEGTESGRGKRRRRRVRKRFEGFEESVVLSKAKKFGYLSSKEEANCCFFLKEGAKVEETRLRIADNDEPSSNDLAIAMGTSTRSVDEILCNRRESQARISRSYRRLVASVALGYQSRGLSFEDLIQEGSIGLLRGAQKFDPQRGYKLSTYAYWWIRQAMLRAIEHKSRAVRLPGNVCGMVAKVADAYNVLSRRLRRCPTHDEIAHLTDLDVETVRFISERSRPPISMDRAMTSRGSITLQDIIPGKDEMMPEKMVSKQVLKRELETLLSTALSEREALVLRLHFGLDGELLSCEEIGQRLKLSRERVRQINNMALSKLKQTSIVNDLRMYIDQ